MTNMPDTNPWPGLPSLPVRVEDARSPVRLSLKLAEAECAALADRFDVHGVESFVLKACVTSLRGHKLQVEGDLSARLIHRCGLTLELFEATISEPFVQIFADAERLDQASLVEFDALSDDQMEPMQDDSVDVAELGYQLFAMALDPFPRKPDALVPDGVLDEADAAAHEGAGDEPLRPSPFAVLKDLKH